jgi:hypothetical protein
LKGKRAFILPGELVSDHASPGDNSEQRYKRFNKRNGILLKPNSYHRILPSVLLAHQFNAASRSS